MLEHLYILGDAIMQPLWQDDLDNTQWLELFHPFTNVKNLYLSREFVQRIALTPQELVGVGETITEAPEALPNLQSIFFQKSPSVPETRRQSMAARLLSSRPIAIYTWIRQDKWSMIGIDD
jgi:hypothetical protein